MSDEEFKGLCNTYGFAPSRSLRELLEIATAQAAISEREACAKVCDAEAQSRQEAAHRNHGTGTPAYGRQMAGVNAAKKCAVGIRARSKA